MASSIVPSPLLDPISLHSQLILEHQAVDLRTPSALFLPSPSYMEGLHATTLDPYKQQYSASRGNPALLGAIAQLYSKIIAKEIDPRTDVLVSAGANACMTEIFLTFLNPGEQVILFEPIHLLVKSQIRHAGGVPVCVSLSGGDMDAEKLRKVFSSKTKIVVINSPSFFASKLYSLSDLQTIASLCEEFDTLCVVDEGFESLVFERDIQRIYSLPGMWDRTISVHSGDTMFGVPSMNIGWIIAHGEFISEIMKVHVMVIFHTPTPTQLALANAIDCELSAGAENSWLSQMNKRAKSARDEMFSLFTEAGLVPVLPVASCYMLVDVSSLNVKNSCCPAEEMVKRGVGCIPRSAFSNLISSQHNKIVVSFLQPPSVLGDLASKLKLFTSHT